MPPTTTLEADDEVRPTAATFKIFSGALKAYEKDGDLRKYLRCTASSSTEDLHGDRMTEECVQGMAPQAKAKGMTIFLNHSYKMPEDVFGKTVDATVISRAHDANGKAIYDLDLEIQLNEANPRAVETYASIKEQGIKAGVSIGAMIEDYAFIDEDAGFWGGLEIKEVNLLEASIVGIPANQRSWVVNAINALGAPKAIIAKALGKDYDIAADPRLAKAAAAVIEPELHEVTFKYIFNGEDVTNSITVESTDTIITEDPDAPEEETPSEEDGEGTDALDPADDETKAVATLADAETALASIKATGVDGALLDIVLGFLEGATEEVVSLRKALEDVTTQRDALLEDVKAAAEIVETLASTPLGRKTQFTGPVNTFRVKFGGLYDEGFLKALDGDEDDE